MKKFTLYLILLLNYLLSNAQEYVTAKNETIINQSIICTLPTLNIDAVFPGDKTNFHKLLKENLKPSSLKKIIKSKTPLLVTFTVQKDGRVSDINIPNSENKKLTKDVTRVMMLMPRWSPKIEQSRPISTKMSLPLIPY